MLIVFVIGFPHLVNGIPELFPQTFRLKDLNLASKRQHILLEIVVRCQEISEDAVLLMGFNFLLALMQWQRAEILRLHL